MQIFSNPLVWLRRIRHRCGYGVHSPFAFRFLTDVVYERTPYYKYAELDGFLPLAWRFRRRKALHLLFRLTNYVQPRAVYVPADCPLHRSYVEAACPRAEVKEKIGVGETDLYVLTSPDDAAVHGVRQGGVVLLDGLHRHRQWFRHLPATVKFDLYDIGIAFYDNQYNEQYYIVNF